MPFAPGGGTDVVARTLAQEMAKDLGASVIIENKPGAGTIIGTQAVATSDAGRLHAADGHVRQCGQSKPEGQAALRSAQDFAAVALIARSFNIVVVNPKSPIKSIADLIAAAKAEPDKLSYGTYGTGTSAHLAGELFKHMAKVNLTTVPYKGAAPAITDLIGGQIQVMFTTVASAASLVAGRSVARARGDLGGALAGISAIADGGGGRRSRLCRGSLVRPVRAGQNTARDHRPPQQIGRQRGAVRGLQEARRERRPGHGGEPARRARPLLPREEDRWRKVIQDAGIKAE